MIHALVRFRRELGPGLCWRIPHLWCARASRDGLVDDRGPTHGEDLAVGHNGQVVHVARVSHRGYRLPAWRRLSHVEDGRVRDGCAAHWPTAGCEDLAG